MNLAVLEPLIVKYLESNPQLVEQLITVLINALVKHLQSQPVAPAA